jgi:hypothetical protein
VFLEPTETLCGHFCSGCLTNWLEKNDYDSYVIFDDDLDMLIEQKDNFINTDFLLGLTSDQINLAEIILNKT